MGRLQRLVRKLLGKSDANDKKSTFRSDPNGKAPVPPARSFSPPRLPHPVQDRAAGAATGAFIGDGAPHSTATTNKHEVVEAGGASTASESQRLPGHGAGTSAQDAPLSERNALPPSGTTHADRDLALSEQESNYSQPDANHSNLKPEPLELRRDHTGREVDHSELTTEHAERGTIPSEQEGSSSAQDTKQDDYKMDLNNTIDVDQVTTRAPAVVQEHVYPTQHEIIERQVHREIHEYHEVQYIQPVVEVEVLPARHWVPGPDGRLVEVAEKDLACVPMVR